MLNKKLMILLLILVLVGIAFAVTTNITRFTTETSTINATFSGDENQTFYIDIPMYAYVNNLTLEIEGISK